MDNTCIKNHIGLMNFFQHWGVQYICDYYEAERDLVGSRYCQNIDDLYDKEFGIYILKQIIKDNPGAFKGLIKKCYPKVSKELLPLFGSNNISDEEYSDIARYLLSDDCAENLRVICDALSKGFLLEWVFFHKYGDEQAAVLEKCEEAEEEEKKKKFIELLVEKKEELDKSEKGFKEWKNEFTGSDSTRQDIIKKFSYEKNLFFYLYRRIYKGYSLEIMFHAFNNIESLKFPRNEEFLHQLIDSHGIGEDVQNFYAFQCSPKQHRNWDTDIVFGNVSEENYERNEFQKIEINSLRENIQTVIENPSSKKEIDDKIKTEKTEFFIKKFKAINYENHSLTDKKVDRRQLQECILKLCKEWKAPNDREWKVVWFEVFLFFRDIGLINPYRVVNNLEGESYVNPPYARFVDCVIKLVVPDYEGKYNDDYLRKYIKQGVVHYPKYYSGKLVKMQGIVGKFKEGIINFLKESKLKS